MKLKILLLVVMIMGPTMASADNCALQTNCSSGVSWYGSHDYCTAGHKTECWYVEGPSVPFNIYSCTACSGNRTLQKTHPGMCTELYYTECVCTNGCTDVSGRAAGTGYQYSISCGASCDTTKKYSCASGYYGTPNSSGTSGCTACPTNATCPGGTTFLCNKGYYQNGNSCTQCGTYTDPNTGLAVYTNSALTTAARGTTSGTGATAVTSCYISAGTYYDKSGTFTLTSSCYYQ